MLEGSSGSLGGDQRLKDRLEGSGPDHPGEKDENVLNNICSVGDKQKQTGEKLRDYNQ